MTRALKITADSLAAALSSMPVMSKRAVRAVIHSGARMMVKEPWRIPMVVDRRHYVFDDLPAAIRQCEHQLAVSEEQAANGSRHFDTNRHLALRQARIALWRLRIEEMVANHRKAEAA